MKFELTDLNKQISDIEIINDLRSVANNLEKKSLKLRDYNKVNGAKYSFQTAKKEIWKLGISIKKSWFRN